MKLTHYRFKKFMEKTITGCIPENRLCLEEFVASVNIWFNPDSTKLTKRRLLKFLDTAIMHSGDENAAILEDLWIDLDRAFAS